MDRFLRDFHRIRGLWDFNVGSSATVGFETIKRLWNQIYNLSEGLIDGKTNFNDAFASQLIGLMIELSEAHHKIEEFLHKLGKLPYVTGAQLDLLQKFPVDRGYSSSGILPQRPRSI
jgi:hypothetical protein